MQRSLVSDTQMVGTVVNEERLLCHVGVGDCSRESKLCRSQRTTLTWPKRNGVAYDVRTGKTLPILSLYYRDNSSIKC